MSYQILFFNDKVREQIDRWPAGILASFTRIAEQIEVTGPDLGMPYTKALGNGLFEIRARGAEGMGVHSFAARLANELSFFMVL